MWLKLSDGVPSLADADGSWAMDAGNLLFVAAPGLYSKEDPQADIEEEAHQGVAAWLKAVLESKRWPYGA